MSEPLEVFVARLLELTTVDEETGRRRLPPERELGDALGMSRGALREQLAVLERLGFLHRTQGRGTYIEKPSYDFVRTFFAIARELELPANQASSESRASLEAALGEATAGHADPDQIADLRSEIARLAASARDDTTS